MLVMVGVLSVSVSNVQRSVSAGRDGSYAQQSALFGLRTALGELQAAAGPDQRVTATAAIFDSDVGESNVKPAIGQHDWTGVWKSGTIAPAGEAPSYDPSNPNEREFVGWLVSGTNDNGDFAIPTELADVENDVSEISPNKEGIENHIALLSKSDGTAHIQVEKVFIDEVKRGKRYFAFSVEDEGVKADLSWSETPALGANGDERAQQRRLSAVPGPDYAALQGPENNGPFGEITYPLEMREGSEGFLTDAISQMRDPADLEALMSNVETVPDWLVDQRSEITWGSRGVMTDVKFGGLRRDLSLAFEMDGDKDVTSNEQPTKFNQQAGEFVGNGDRLSAPATAKGMGAPERFLYRDYLGSGTPFSGDIFAAANKPVRGPNWHVLRDYANLYKRLRKPGGKYTLDARSYYPNVSASNTPGYQYGTLMGVHSGLNTWDGEMSRHGYVFKPARANYAPVLLGYVAAYSVLATNQNGSTADLALGIDPFFYLWNPYNRKLKVDKYAIRLTTFAGHVTFWITDENGTRTRHGPSTVSHYIRNHANQGGQLSYLVSDLTMEPGEVIVVSTGSNRSRSANEYHDEAYPGTNTDNKSGAILTDIPDQYGRNWRKIKLNLKTDRVEFLFAVQYRGRGDKDAQGNWTAQTNMAEHIWVDTNLPKPGTKAIDLTNWRLLGDHIQQIGNNAQGDLSVPEHFDPPRHRPGTHIPAPTGNARADTLVDTKRFFAVNNYLTKPAAHEGQEPNPLEVFAHFNPFPMAGYVDMWRPCLLNQTFTAIADPGDVDTLLQRAGINFPALALENGFWGESYATGATAFPMSNIPSGPLTSLAAFSHANVSVGAGQPFHPIGNSWSNIHISPVSPFGQLVGMPWMRATASDSSWLLNDALFDRYYLSGIAPDYNIASNGYAKDGTLFGTLTKFFSADYQRALANPVLRPYLPPGMKARDVVAALAADDGYKKMGAYSLIQGLFNVNSTSVSAWEAFLRANRDLKIQNANGGSNMGAGAPFPSSASPAGYSDGTQEYWTGFSRLTNDKIRRLAEEIVRQVKIRGPFMSLSDFVNHRVGTPKNAETHYMGALQAAIEAAEINKKVQGSAHGMSPVYDGLMKKYFPDPPPTGNRQTTTGIPGDITQANLLLPLAPRLSARSDTFRIRSYGEVRSTDGTRITSRAACEAVVQRIPEYVDPETDPENNEPWDEATDPFNPTESMLNETNQMFGRRFKIVQFRWLAPDEL